MVPPDTRTHYIKTKPQPNRQTTVPKRQKAEEKDNKAKPNTTWTTGDLHLYDS